MRKLLRLSILASLVILPLASNAQPYIGANLGGSIVSISKNVNYLTAYSTTSDKYNSLRVQAVAGLDIHFNYFTDFPENTTNAEYTTKISKAYNYTRRSHGRQAPEEFYIALEVDASYNSGQASQHVNPWFLTYEASVQEQQRYNYELFLLGKYRMSQNVILFLGPAVSRGLFAVSSNGATGGNLGITGSTSTWLSGYAIKAGIEVPMYDYASLVVTYQYTYYNPVTFTRPEPFTSVPVTAQYKPILNSFTVGLNWR